MIVRACPDACPPRPRAVCFGLPVDFAFERPQWARERIGFEPGGAVRGLEPWECIVATRAAERMGDAGAAREGSVTRIRSASREVS